jgi:hypothetical protein
MILDCDQRQSFSVKVGAHKLLRLVRTHGKHDTNRPGL